MKKYTDSQFGTQLAILSIALRAQEPSEYLIDKVNEMAEKSGLVEWMESTDLCLPFVK